MHLSQDSQDQGSEHRTNAGNRLQKVIRMNLAGDLGRPLFEDLDMPLPQPDMFDLLGHFTLQGGEIHVVAIKGQGLLGDRLKVLGQIGDKRATLGMISGGMARQKTNQG